MNCGFEDCTVFDEMYQESKGNWDGLFSRFSDRRVPDGNAILDLALMNYIEMRDLTANPDFLLQKKIEAKFSELYPDLWMPLYSQVTFSHIPYSEALKNGERQQQIMKEIFKIRDIQKNWDTKEVMQKMLALVK